MSPRAIQRSDATATPEALQNAGVFKQNRARPFHRWYPFVEGFASDLVDWGIELVANPTPRIFDPFGGSGTTALTAATRGLDSAFCEVNPYLAWLAGVKVNSSRLLLGSRGLESLDWLATALDNPNVDLCRSSNGTEPILVADEQRNYFPPTVAEQVVGAFALVSQDWDAATQCLGRAAIAVSLVPSSNMVRRTDLRRRTPGDAEPVSFRHTAANNLRRMLEDIRLHGDGLTGQATMLASDVRQLEPDGVEPFDIIVTSPPYLNGTNYERNTKLELLALGMIPSERELAQLRTDSITAGINGVSRRRPQPKLFPEVEHFAVQLDEVAYDVRIPALVRGYFSDMQVALQRMREVSIDSGELILDIGDSRFAGVSVPVPELLGQIAAEVGWYLKETIHIRNRRSFDGTPLVQVLQRMVAS